MKKKIICNETARWTSEEIKKEKKEVEKIREIFRSKGITGEEACSMVLRMRHGKEE